MRVRLLVLALLPALSIAAPAATRTMITDFTGLDCAVNSNGGDFYVEPSVDSDMIQQLDDGTEVHILGGKQFGRFIAFPSSDEAFARTWFKIKAKGQIGWIQSGSVNCGG
jgi:hypothetical protein